MEKSNNLNIDIHSLYEIMQDNFLLTLLEGILNSFTNIEAKNIIECLIAEISPIFIYEAYQFFKGYNLCDSNNIFKNKELKKKVTKYRMISTHEEIKKSKYIEKLKNKMGLDFANDVYDINVIANESQIQGFNFSEFNKHEDRDFLSSCYTTNFELAKITFEKITGYTIDDYYSIINHIIKEKKEEIKLLENRLKGVRYSYKSSKLFINSKIDNIDKLFILYRYNNLKGIIELNKFFEKTKIKFGINDDIVIDSDNFINKLNALEITVLGNDIQTNNTTYINKLKDNLDKTILNRSSKFYKLNRILRNNIHYSKIEKLTTSEYSEIEDLQTLYLNYVYNSMVRNIFFKLDKNDKTMNDFFTYCRNNNICKEELQKNYEEYFKQFIYTKYNSK